MFLAYTLLSFSILSVWLSMGVPGIPKMPLWLGIFCLAAGTAAFVGILTLVSLAELLLFAIVTYTAGKRMANGQKYRSIVVLTAALSLILAMHVAPGFNNPFVVKDYQVSRDAVPYTLYLNFDKASVGLFLLAFFCRPNSSVATIKNRLLVTIALGLTASTVVLSGAMLLGLVNFDPKFTDLTLIFLAVNLLFTCIAEECFFRGIIQETICRSVTPKYLGNWLSIILSAVLFGLIHWPTGHCYVILSFFVGLFSAYGYARTKKVEVAIFVHFFVNAMHFSFFTYPFLA